MLVPTATFVFQYCNNKDEELLYRQWSNPASILASAWERRSLLDHTGGWAYLHRINILARLLLIAETRRFLASCAACRA